MNKKRILFIGGGSGGHIMPLIPLIRELKEHQLFLISADQDIDRTINTQYVPEYVQCSYIRTGKLRRYFDLQNFIDIFRTLKAIWTAHLILKNIKPNILFLKGGYVGVPFALANRFFRHNIPLFTHESDQTSGLATRIANRYATQQFGNFLTPPTPLFYVPKEKPTNPYKTDLKKILVLSGSLGGVAVNNIIETNAEELLKTYHLTVISGKGKSLQVHNPNFEQHELLSPEKLSDYLHHCDLVISRGGANSLLEIINAKKPSIIIPLPGTSSRGDQYLNAKHFADQNLCHILEQDEAQKTDLLKLIHNVMTNKTMQEALGQTEIMLKAREIAKVLLSTK